MTFGTLMVEIYNRIVKSLDQLDAYPETFYGGGRVNKCKLIL